MRVLLSYAAQPYYARLRVVRYPVRSAAYAEKLAWCHTSVTDYDDFVLAVEIIEHPFCVNYRLLVAARICKKFLIKAIMEIIYYLHPMQQPT